jgi:PAS domain S-box-containing protein
MSDTPRTPEHDAHRLLAELRVHQVELEEQNAALREARDAAERALAAYTDLYDHAPVGYATVDDRGTIVSANLSLATLLGIRRETLLGRSWLLMVDPLDRPAMLAHLARTAGGEAAEAIEARVLAADGTLRTVAVAAAPGVDAGSCRLALTDQTQRRLAEEAAQQALRMDAVGRLAGGVAHDLNNLLTIIGGSNEFVLESLPAEHPAFETARATQVAVGRAGELTSRLLAFARPQVLALRDLDLNDAVREFASLFRRVLSARIELRLDLHADAGLVRLDPVQLQQVLMNLAINAADAMRDGGTLVVETRPVAAVDAALAGRGARDGVRLRVADTGSGMDDATRTRIFEPFFTTKALGEGTGLGLATVHAIVRQGGGQVHVDSAPGRGTRMDIHWPRVTAARSTPATPVPVMTRPPEARGETVLVVDDEPGIVAFVAEVLRRGGYRCLRADGGAAALAVLSQERGVVALLIADVVMPAMDGATLVRRALAAHPALAVLFMTGYASTAELLGAAPPPHAGVLRKPFTAHALLTETIRALAARRMTLATATTDGAPGLG